MAGEAKQRQHLFVTRTDKSDHERYLSGRDLMYLLDRLESHEPVPIGIVMEADDDVEVNLPGAYDAVDLGALE